MIQLYNVSKVYPAGNRALTDINLKIEKGDFVFLVGASGAGKSSFMKLLLREELPTRGQVFVAGKSLIRMKRREVPYLRRNLGMVFQDFRLLNNYTVFDNVAFALRVVEAPTRDIPKQVEEVLKLVGLQGKGQILPERLSGGEQQRVGIARAIINKPMILLADEPTGNLDTDTSWEIMKILTEVNKRGTTVVMATHAQDIVDKMRRRVLEIENGRLIRDEKRGAYIHEE